MSQENHPYHLVDYSPWSILGALAAMITMMGIISWFHFFNHNLLLLGFNHSINYALMMTSYHPSSNISKSSYISRNNSMILFITSEVFFFISFFWGFFQSSLSPTTEIGMNWQPKGITPFNPIQVTL